MVDFHKIEKKWQKKWEDKKIFKVKEDPKAPKYYCLEMFPYPSGSGLHMGHAFNYTIGDIYTRFKRMNGFNVLYPMGYDSFGLPAENAAIKAKVHPKKFTTTAINNFISQQKALGLSYDWDRMLSTCTPEYYKWNQFFFLKFMEKGLVDRKKAPVNWCPKCNTVLANEQVHDGKCWRHTDTDVEQKDLEQWFLKTTEYADELLDIVDDLQWPERIKIMQKNWIGKKEGYDQYYKVEGMNITLSTFTTHHHTSFAEIFIAIAPEHPIALELVKGTEQEKGALEFIERIKNNKARGEFMAEAAKEGYFTGRYTKDPCSGRDLPIYIADFALMEFGTGIVKASCHDQRDFDFAKTHDIRLFEVLFPNKLVEKKKNIYDVIHPGLDNEKMRNYRYNGAYDGKKIGTVKINIKTDLAEIEIKIDKNIPYAAMQESAVLRQLTQILFYQEGKADKIVVTNMKDCSMKLNDFVEIGFIPNDKNQFILEKGKEQIPLSYDGQGYMFDSAQFTGMSVPEARIKMGDWMEDQGYAKKSVAYSLRDWLVSRQRYWGTPIPVIHCEKCGIVPVPEKDLPVLLPEKVRFGKGNPLETSKSFIEIKCPKCKAKARRETDTMDTFFDSSWYFLRYCDNKNNKEPFEKKKAKYWMPVDQYIGGAEHACMHLIYARFFTKALRDLGYIGFDEPFTKLFNQGMLHGEDGFVMSKSRGNVVLPEAISKKYGIDTARFFLVSIASPDKDLSWSDAGIEGSSRFIHKVWNYFHPVKIGKSSKKVESKLNKAIKGATEDIENFRYNLAIIKIRELFDSLEPEVSLDTLEKFLKLLHPFCPHFTEELWEKIGNKPFISLASWPKYDESKIDLKAEEAEKIFENTITDIRNVLKLTKINNPKEIILFAADEWKYKFFKNLKKEIEKTRDIGELIRKTMIKDHGKDISAIIPKLVKDPSKIPEVILDQKTEINALRESIDKIKKEFKAESVAVIRAEESEEDKAKQAMPGKPAIFLVK
ncbi:leucine--tRNA ligase [Candidatus Woesearchaeota archaeon]|nr:leucine--tRNA ligase [Candidatus Woesearchaeota archaeon]